MLQQRCFPLDIWLRVTAGEKGNVGELTSFKEKEAAVLFHRGPVTFVDRLMVGLSVSPCRPNTRKRLRRESDATNPTCSWAEQFPESSFVNEVHLYSSFMVPKALYNGLLFSPSLTMTCDCCHARLCQPIWSILGFLLKDTTTKWSKI